MVDENDFEMESSPVSETGEEAASPTAADETEDELLAVVQSAPLPERKPRNRARHPKAMRMYPKKVRLTMLIVKGTSNLPMTQMIMRMFRSISTQGLRNLLLKKTS